MAIVAPVYVQAERGQDITVTVTIPTDTTGWTATATLRAYTGGTALATKTTSSGITNTPGASSSTMVVAFDAADLTLAPGSYIWELVRTNSGYMYPIVDVSTFRIVVNSSGAYPSLTNLSAYVVHALGNSTPSDASALQIQQLLAASEDLIQELCGRKFVYGTYTEYLDGTGTDSIYLRETPARSITSLYLDTDAYYGEATGSFASETLLTSGTDYVLVKDRPDGYSWSGRVLRIGSFWPYSWQRPVGYLGLRKSASPGCVKVVYSAGFDLIPTSLQLAVWDMTTLMREASTDGRVVNSESGEGYSVSRSGIADDVKRLGSVQQVVSMYRRRNFVS